MFDRTEYKHEINRQEFKNTRERSGLSVKEVMCIIWIWDLFRLFTSMKMGYPILRWINSPAMMNLYEARWRWSGDLK